MPCEGVTPLRGAAESVVGMVTVRGEPAPVVDMRRALARSLEDESYDRLTIVRVGGRFSALLVDAVSGAHQVDENDLLDRRSRSPGRLCCWDSGMRAGPRCDPGHRQTAGSSDGGGVVHDAPGGVTEAVSNQQSAISDQTCPHLGLLQDLPHKLGLGVGVGVAVITWICARRS